MNKREQRKQIEEILKENMLPYPHSSIWQDKPYTAVKVITKYEGVQYQQYGFAKVCHPDTWDAVYGVELAVAKAVAKISKEIINAQ